MVVKLKDATIELIEDTDTRMLKLLRIVSKNDGATLTLELPEALCGRLNVQDSIDVVLDSKPILKSEKSKLYVEGTVFKLGGESGLEVVGTIGGLRMVLNLLKATPAKRKTFSTNQFYLMIP